jgi:hypothetical protein
MQANIQEPQPADASKITVYFVNGERQETTEHKLAVKTILANAGFEPTDEWVLSRDQDGHEFSDQDELVPIHKDERFTATRQGPTPTS